MVERIKDMAETPQSISSEGRVQSRPRSQLEQISDRQGILIREFRGTNDEQRREEIRQQFTQSEQEVDLLMLEARDIGMLAGLDFELDDYYRRIISHAHPSQRREELRRIRAEVKARIGDLNEGFVEEFVPDQVSKYAGAQQIYLESGLEVFEQVARGEERINSERMWEWTTEEYRLRAIEDELAARSNQERHEEEDKTKDRRVTIEEFVRLKSVVDNQQQIEWYVQARFNTDLNSYPEDQRAYIQQEIEARVGNTHPRLRQIGDEAWRNFQMVDSLQAYAKARQDLADIGSIPENQRAQVYQAAQLVIAQTPETQRRIADEVLDRRGHVPSTPEGFVEVALKREEGKLFKLATRVIVQEEKTGEDRRNYLQLHEAYRHIETIMPEALSRGILEGLSYQMNNLYKEYRDKIRDGSIQPGYRADLEVLRDKEMISEKGWWDDHMRDSGFSEIFRDRFEGARAFYTYRAFQRLLQLIENRGEGIASSERQRQFNSLLTSGINGEQKQRDLSEQFNREQDRLEQLFDIKQISQAQYDAEMVRLHTLFLRELNSERERKVMIGEWTPLSAEQNILRDTEEEAARRMERDSFWDRSWGRVVLTGETPEQFRRGVANFLAVATNQDSNFDPQRYISDATELSQEILRRGKGLGIDEGEVLDLAAEAEATLITNVAHYFATHWHMNEWHQVTSILGRHINSRLSALSKAHDTEVIHAAHILDTEDEYATFGRPATRDGELSSTDNEVATDKRNRVKRKLQVRIAFSRLKSRDEIIRDNFNGIETLIDSFGFDRNNDQLSADQLFDLPGYLNAINTVRSKLAEFDRKYAQAPNSIQPADRLTDEERKLLFLDRIRLFKGNKDLAITDQTEEQFRSLYHEDQSSFDINIADIRNRRGNAYAQIEQQLVDVSRQLQELRRQGRNISFDDFLNTVAEADRGEYRLILQELLLKKYIGKEGEQYEGLSSLESEFLQGTMPNWNKAQQAVDLAIKTRDVFFVSAERACASIKTRLTDPNPDTKGELLSFNDGIRFNHFVRERALLALPKTVTDALTSSTSGGAGLMYVEIADKLEFRRIAEETIRQANADRSKNDNDPTRRIRKGSEDDYAKSAEVALKLITFTTQEQQYILHVQAVEDAQTKALDKLRELGSRITVNEVDEVIRTTFSGLNITVDTARTGRGLQSIHRGESSVRDTQTYKDIITREDADPQYNFSMMDDSKYRSLLLSDEIRSAAYNKDHPHYFSIPATARRVLDPDGTKLVRKFSADGGANPIQEKVDTYGVMEIQRRFHFAVDSPKVFGAFYRQDPYGRKPVDNDLVINITNSPFIARRSMEQRTWTTWEQGMAYRGRGFLKYHESNLRGLDHSTGVSQRGLRGMVAGYTGYDPGINFSGILDELKAELWLDQAKSADAVRPVLVGGQVGDKAHFEGLFKKVLSTPGRVNIDYKGAHEAHVGNVQNLPVLVRIARTMTHPDEAESNWKAIYAGDYETAINDTIKIWERLVVYGNSYGFVGNVSHIPLAAKFTGDTAIKRMAYWALAHPEGFDTYGINMPIARTILTPLKQVDHLGGRHINYFGENATLLAELLRREILNK